MWKMIHYAVRGRGHVAENIPCQDKTIALTKNDVSVIALADGAGSAKYSHIGAQTTINAVSDYIVTNFDMLVKEQDGVVIKQLFQKIILDALKEDQQVLDCELNALASTLLVVAIKDETFFLLHVGDGVIGYVKDEQLYVASKPSNGEFTNSTVFVTSSRLIENMNLIKGTLQNISGFILMSDGTAESLYEKNQQRLAPIVKRLIDWTALLPKQNMLNIVEQSFNNVISSRTLDDCSIAIITNQQNILQKYKALNTTEKYYVLQLPKKDSRTLKKKVLRYDYILQMLAQPKTLDQVSKEIRLKRKYTKKRMDILIQKGLIIKRGGYYIAK